MFNIENILNMLMPLLIVYILFMMFKPILDEMGITGKKITIKTGTKDKTKIEELSKITYDYLKSDALIHGSQMARKLFLKTGLDTYTYIGHIIGWNKNKEITYFYIKRGLYKRYIIMTNKEFDTLHYDVTLNADTIGHITKKILYVYDYNKLQEDFDEIYNFLQKEYLKILSIQAHDGQYVNIVSIFRKDLARHIDYNTIKDIKQISKMDLPEDDDND